MNNLNNVNLVGNLGDDMRIVDVSGGSQIGSFSICCTESYKNDKNEKVERSNWFNCVVFGKYSSVLSKQIVKGSKVHVSGSLRSRSYDHPAKGKVFVVEVVVSSVLFLK